MKNTRVKDDGRKGDYRARGKKHNSTNNDKGGWVGVRPRGHHLVPRGRFRTHSSPIVYRQFNMGKPRGKAAKKARKLARKKGKRVHLRLIV